MTGGKIWVVSYRQGNVKSKDSVEVSNLTYRSTDFLQAGKPGRGHIFPNAGFNALAPRVFEAFTYYILIFYFETLISLYYLSNDLYFKLKLGIKENISIKYTLHLWIMEIFTFYTPIYWFREIKSLIFNNLSIYTLDPYLPLFFTVNNACVVHVTCPCLRCSFCPLKKIYFAPPNYRNTDTLHPQL